MSVGLANANSSDRNAGDGTRAPARREPRCWANAALHPFGKGLPFPSACAMPWPNSGTLSTTELPAWPTSPLRTRASLHAEIAALRDRLAVYQRSGQRPRISPSDRLLWSVVSRLWSGWRTALYFVQPRAVADWQKKPFRDHWRRLSQSRPIGRPRVSAELRSLIQRLWRANPTWGSPHIVVELNKLGISVAKSTVERYRPRRDGPPPATGKSFLELHVKQMASIDFFVVPTVRFKIPSPRRA